MPAWQVAAPGADLVCRYRPAGDPYHAQHGSLEKWLTERYCMYPVGKDGQVYRGEIHHASWTLQPAAAEFEANTMVLPQGLRLPDYSPLLHFARRLDVVVWGLERVKSQ